MKMIFLCVLALALGGLAHAQSANPLTSGARLHYGIIKGYVVRAAAKMPEEYYSFRATPEVRSFAQLVGHLPDANYRLCSVLAGADPPVDAGIERDRKTKADLVKALDESFVYCDKIYADMTDEAGKPIVKFDAGGEGSRVPIQMPRLTVLGVSRRPCVRALRQHRHLHASQGARSSLIGATGWRI